MSLEPITNEGLRHDGAVTEKFLDTPQLIAFFRSSRCEPALAEDLAQEVMFIVYRKAGQIRDRSLHWMAFLDSRESEVMTLRFIEQWEYHEIAAAQTIPIRTVQWKVFNAKKKLAPYLTTRNNTARKAA